MRKIFALYQNEMIKLYHKKSVYIILGLMVFFIIATGLIMYTALTFTSSDKWNADQLQNEINFLQDEMEYYNSLLDGKTENDIDNSDEGLNMYNLFTDIKDIQQKMKVIEFCMQNNINYHASTYFILELKNKYDANELNLYKQNLSDKSGLGITVVYDIQKLIDDNKAISAVISSGSFTEYINYMNNIIDSDTTFSSEEKQIYKEINEIRLNSNLTGESESDNALINSLNSIKLYKLSLADNTDQVNGSSDILLPSKRAEYEDTLVKEIYKLESGYYKQMSADSNAANISSASIMSMVSTGVSFLLILVLILAGGAISSEISTGSIKSLVIAPVKRQKIFIAKVLTLLTVIFIGTGLAYVFSMVTYGIFFGFSNALPYIYVFNGAAKEIPFAIYILEYTAISCLSATIFYMTFALMLSSITKNTSTSVGVSIGVYFLSSSIVSVLRLFVNGDWFKFIPFANLSIADAVFPSLSASILGGMPINTVNNINPVFSACYIAILAFTMYLIGFDAFCRRDIK